MKRRINTPLDPRTAPLVELRHMLPLVAEPTRDEESEAEAKLLAKLEKRK